MTDKLPIPLDSVTFDDDFVYLDVSQVKVLTALIKAARRVRDNDHGWMSYGLRKAIRGVVTAIDKVESKII